jgi:hypothetical protein
MFTKAQTGDLSYLVNHPDIFPHTGAPEGSFIDMKEVLKDPRNVGFVTINGGMLFGYIEEGVYECHFLFIPGSEGHVIKDAAKAMIMEMFTNRGAHVIKGHPPRDNRAVRTLGVSLGFKKVPNSEFTDDLGRSCETYEIRK